MTPLGGLHRVGTSGRWTPLRCPPRCPSPHPVRSTRWTPLVWRDAQPRTGVCRPTPLTRVQLGAHSPLTWSVTRQVSPNPVRKQTARGHATPRGSCSYRTANAWIPLAVKASSKSGIAVRCGVRGDDAGAGLMPPFPRALEASVKSGAARRLRDHRETRRARSDVNRHGASPLQGRPLVHPRARALPKDRAPGVRWCRERLLRWRTNESLD